MTQIIASLEIARLLVSFVCMISLCRKKWYNTYICAMVLTLMLVVEIVLSLIAGIYVPVAFLSDVLLVMVLGFITTIAEKKI